MSESNERYQLVEAACNFWFNDNDKVRSPFPASIQDELKKNAQAEYMLWVKNLTERDRKEVDDDELASVFEMFLFSEALKLVDEEDTDLLLTIHHPFMPRIGDVVNDESRGPSKVVGRQVKPKEDERMVMIISMEVVDSKETWESEFLLPK
jgi:hypothetical protein